MKFIIEREKILKPLSRLSNYVSISNKNPILSNVFMCLDKLLLIFIVTDLQIEINFYIKLVVKNIIKTGSTTINVRKFYDLCRNFPEKSKIYICLVNNRLKLYCLNSICFFSTMPSCDFPLINKHFICNSKLTISVSLLKEIINSINFAMGNEDIRFYLNGILLEYKKGKIFFIATDGYRMSTYVFLKKKLDKYYNLNEFFVIFPRKLILELFKFLNLINKKQKINFEIGINIVKIYFDKYTIYSGLINGNFPNYKNILLYKKKKNYKFIDLNVLELKNSLNRSFIISDYNFSYVTFFFNNNKLTIFSNNQNNDEIEEKICIENINFKLKISFNIKYILDVLNVLKDLKTIRFFFKDNKSIVIFSDINNSCINHMIMPINL